MFRDFLRNKKSRPQSRYGQRQRNLTSSLPRILQFYTCVMKMKTREAEECSVCCETDDQVNICSTSRLVSVPVQTVHREFIVCRIAAACVAVKFCKDGFCLYLKVTLSVLVRRYPYCHDDRSMRIVFTRNISFQPTTYLNRPALCKMMALFSVTRSKSEGIKRRCGLTSVRM